MNGDAALLAAGKAQVALLQAAGHPGNLRQGSGNGLFQIPCEEKDAHNDDGKAYQGGIDYRHKNLMVGLCGRDAGKEEAVDRSGGVSGGDIGAQVFLIQNSCPAHIALSFLQHNFRQLGGQRGAHNPLPVLDHGGVGPGISFKDGKLTAHAAFQIIQQLVDVLCAAGLAQEVIQHIGAVGAALLQHPGCQRAEHNHAHAHGEDNGYHLHDDDHIAHFFADAGLFSFRALL